MSVREAQERIDAREFAEWIDYYTIEPFGEWRDDLRLAMCTAALLNQMVGLKGRRGQVTASDLMPKFGQKSESDADDRKMFRTLEAMRKADESRKARHGKYR